MLVGGIAAAAGLSLLGSAREELTPTPGSASPVLGTEARSPEHDEGPASKLGVVITQIAEKQTVVLDTAGGRPARETGGQSGPSEPAGPEQEAGPSEPAGPEQEALSSEPAAAGQEALSSEPAAAGQEALSSEPAAAGHEALPLLEPAAPGIAAGTVVGEGKADADGDGRTDTVRIRMTEGEERTDPNPGAFEGTHLHGTFEAVAETSDGRELGRFPLNEAFGGGEMIFRKGEPFRLLFDDYNDDGRPDFTVGQWGGSNGNFYVLLTIGPEGFQVLAKEIYSADHRESIRYRRTGKLAFRNIYYDQTRGAYMEVIRRWKDGAFAAEAPGETQDVGSAGVDP
ncbi:hypothetical protein B2K_40085 [Paenibacillus mucilaginosus K02]|uniref:Uncharacterized protein n=1 Tax=Paenibacillus mucilaginosus K02 TaxID=997761 RepID=I0BR55_9BACL|nr:hypothetical protein B2K_40085 [Paenibacillus mucilaginosus K02]